MEIMVKELGQTIEHKGEVVLVSKGLPGNCMVLFVSMDVWREIKDRVKVVREGSISASQEYENYPLTPSEK